MRKITTLFGGIVLGFVLAHFVNQNPRGRQFFEHVNRVTDEVLDAVREGYSTR